MRIATAVFIAALTPFGTFCQENSPVTANPPNNDGKLQVMVRSIGVKGSRLASESLVHLTGLRAGQVLDEAKLRLALQNATASGLFKNISYSYESVPDSTDIKLELVVEDQRPLVPATIKIAKVDSAAVWEFLAKTDALFGQEVPPTVNAIKLYERYINKYLQSVGRADIAAVGNVTGSNPPTGVVFEAVKLRNAK
jgi:hypothetical protein